MQTSQFRINNSKYYLISLLLCHLILLLPALARVANWPSSSHNGQLNKQNAAATIGSKLTVVFNTTLHRGSGWSTGASSPIISPSSKYIVFTRPTCMQHSWQQIVFYERDADDNLTELFKDDGYSALFTSDDTLIYYRRCSSGTCLASRTSANWTAVHNEVAVSATTQMVVNYNEELILSFKPFSNILVAHSLSRLTKEWEYRVAECAGSCYYSGSLATSPSSNFLYLLQQPQQATFYTNTIIGIKFNETGAETMFATAMPNGLKVLAGPVVGCDGTVFSGMSGYVFAFDPVTGEQLYNITIPRVSRTKSIVLECGDGFSPKYHIYAVGVSLSSQNTTVIKATHPTSNITWHSVFTNSDFIQGKVLLTSNKVLLPTSFSSMIALDTLTGTQQSYFSSNYAIDNLAIGDDGTIACASGYSDFYWLWKPAQQQQQLQQQQLQQQQTLH